MSMYFATFEDDYRVSVIIAAMKESNRSGNPVVTLYQYEIALGYSV